MLSMPRSGLIMSYGIINSSTYIPRALARQCDSRILIRDLNFCRYLGVRDKCETQYTYGRHTRDTYRYILVHTESSARDLQSSMLPHNTILNVVFIQYFDLKDGK